MVYTVHTALHNQIHQYIANMFQSKARTVTRNIRECAHTVPTCKLDVSYRDLSYKGAVLYNHLNTNSTNAPVIQLFGNRYTAEYCTKF